MTFDVFQQIYALSLASNLVNEMKGTQTSLQQELQQIVASILPIVGEGWQLAWGPVVWKNEPENASTGPDNSWYIAFHPALQFEDGSVRPAYVIAIAGTPGASTYAWYKEDFAVNSVSDFGAWVAGGIQNAPQPTISKDIIKGNAYIATGTVNAVYTLLTTPTPEGAVSEGNTLLEFISGLDTSTSPVFITAGHSLGGALSPSLALALASAEYIPADSTLTYPSAGPSPGNGGFTELFTETFPPRKLSGALSYQGWNLNLVNTLDIVPQAWCVFRTISPQQNLGNIPPIYGTPTLAPVTGATIVFSLSALSSGVQYKPLPSQYFTGTAPSAPPESLKEFLSFAIPQHTNAYFKEVGIPIATSKRPKAFSVELREKTGTEILYNYPVISDLQWELEHQAKANEIIDEAKASLPATPGGNAFLSENAYIGQGEQICL